METLIRRAITKDVEKILEIVNYEILNSTVLYDYKERTYEQQLNWFEQKQIIGMPIVVAEYKDVVVGFGTYGIFRPWAAYQLALNIQFMSTIILERMELGNNF